MWSLFFYYLSNLGIRVISIGESFPNFFFLAYIKNATILVDINKLIQSELLVLVRILPTQFLIASEIGTRVVGETHFIQRDEHFVKRDKSIKISNSEYIVEQQNWLHINLSVFTCKIIANNMPYLCLMRQFLHNVFTASKFCCFSSE